MASRDQQEPRVGFVVLLVLSTVISIWLYQIIISVFRWGCIMFKFSQFILIMF